MGADRGLVSDRLPVHPDPASCEHVTEGYAVSLASRVEHFGDRSPGQLVSAGASRLTGGREETHDCHGPQRTGTDSLARDAPCGAFTAARPARPERMERREALAGHRRFAAHRPRTPPGAGDRTIARLGRRCGVLGRGVERSDSRASETATIIASELGSARGRVRVISDARLREADAGPWQGMTPREIEAEVAGVSRGPSASGRFRDRRVRGRPAPSDACADLLDARIESRADRRRGRSVIAITHSGLIRALRRHLGAADESVPNLGGVWVHLVDDQLHLGPLFTIDGLAISGVDGPGEDPGEEADDARRSRSRRARSGGLIVPRAAATCGNVPVRGAAGGAASPGSRRSRAGRPTSPRPDRRRPSEAARGSIDRSARAARRPG